MPSDTYPTGQPKATGGPDKATGKPQSTQGPGRVRAPSARARVSSGRKLLVSCDGRSIWARMFADYYASLIAQLGGEQVISEARRMLCRRASLFEVELNIIEGELAKLRGQGNMKMLARKTALEWLAQYTTMVNSQRRVLEAVGLNRVAREVPTLSSYIAEIESRKAGGWCRLQVDGRD